MPHTGDAQCDVTVRIPFTGQEAQRIAVDVEPNDVVCLDCLDTNGNTRSDTLYSFPSGAILPGQTTPGLGTNVGGTLQLIPGRLMDGSNALGTNFFCTVNRMTNNGIGLYTTSKWGTNSLRAPYWL